jgi:hypothetical protein
MEEKENAIYDTERRLQRHSLFSFQRGLLLLLLFLLLLLLRTRVR